MAGSARNVIEAEGQLLGDSVEKLGVWYAWRGVMLSLGRVFSWFCHHPAAAMRLRRLKGVNRPQAGARILRFGGG